jgi:hypothetical protein
MIVVHEPPEFLVITQPDHARLSGELLSLWIRDGLPDHPRREELLFATREHDNGWREADAAPRYDVVGQRPCDFKSFPSSNRLEIWQRGIERFSEEHPYVALLIAHHAEMMYRQASVVPEGWREHLVTLEDRRQEWFDRAAINQRELDHDYRFLQTADLLSLAACDGWRNTLDTGLVRASAAEAALRLSPFPLAGATTLQVPYRRIPDRSYRGDADLGGELAMARWSDLAIRLVPGPASP